jgi:hypothetical protein
MSPLPQPDAGLSCPMSCVLDGELAFSSLGLLLAFRLARAPEVRLWLFRAIWQALDGSDIPLWPPDVDAGAAACGQNVFPSPNALHQWELARLETDLAGLQFFFVGDARHESLLPKEVDKDVVTRFELFSEELDALHQRSCVNEGAGYDPGYECQRDAAALAAALIRHRPVVLSRHPRNSDRKQDRAEPPLCDFLRGCGIECHFVDPRNAAAMRSHFEPIFVRCGLAEIVWDMARDGQDLVSIHLVAPNALVTPTVEPDFDRGFGDEIARRTVREGRNTPFWFREAKAYWWAYA